jgi:hypothetical protein
MKTCELFLGAVYSSESTSLRVRGIKIMHNAAENEL